MNKIKFISYDGEYPCLCIGTLVLEIEGKRVELKNVLSSGGSCFIDNHDNEIVEEGPWSINVPEEYQQHKEENKVLDKALELMACSFFGNLSCIYFPNTDTQIETNVALVDYFKNLAKEMMKSE